MRSADQEGHDHITLSVADVYTWLSTEGHFPRSAVKEKIASRDFKRTTRKHTNVDFNQATEVHCRRCGLHYLLHPSPTYATRGIKLEENAVKQEPEDFAAPLTGNWHPDGVCIVFNDESTEISRPALDIRNFLRLSDIKPKGQAEIISPSQPVKVSNFISPPSPLVATPRHMLLSASDLVAVADPTLVNALRRISPLWNLDFLNGGTPRDLNPNAFNLIALNHRRADIEDELAPFALLAVLAKSMTRVLIDIGLETFRADERHLRTLGKPRARGLEQKLAIRRLLTPSHILRGLEQSGTRRDDDKVRPLIRVLLGSLGISSPSSSSGSVHPQQ